MLKEICFICLLFTFFNSSFLQDYSWEDHGYSLVNRLYPDVGQMLDEKFQMAYNLTYNTMATHKDVDTSMLRRAIWNYIHCMFGIRSVTGNFVLSCDVTFVLQRLSFLLSQRRRASMFPHTVSLCFSGMTTMITER